MPQHLFWNILLHFGLEGDKIHKIRKMFFSYPLQQICNTKEFTHAITLNISQSVNKNKLKVWKFKCLSRLVSFSATKKTVEGKRGKFVLLLSLFLSVHINFQYKLKYHIIPFIITFYLFYFFALLIFSHLQFQCFFL